MSRQLDAIQADLGPLHAEVNRLCSMHDGRLVLAAVLSSAVSIGQVLSQHGKSSFVIDTFIGAADDATRPMAADTKVIYTDGDERLGSKQ